MILIYEFRVLSKNKVMLGVLVLKSVFGHISLCLYIYILCD